MLRWSTQFLDLLMRRNLPAALLFRAFPGEKGQRSSEFEQACVRIVFGSLLLCYFGYQQFERPLDSAPLHIGIVTALSVFLAASVAIAVSLRLWPTWSTFRRICTIALDVGTLTYLLLIGDRHSAPLYFLYLWIIIGNGFRFGRAYLFISLGLTLLGFGLVISQVPYWREEFELSIGLWIGTLLISIYFNLLVGRLFRALDEANVANAAKRQFICAVSHELRTPLNAIIGMVDLLKTKQMDREQQEMLDCMTTTSQMMLSQIDDVLDFSRIEAGKMSVESVVFDLYELLHGTLAVFRYRIDRRVLDMRSWIGHDVPVLLQGDPHHLRQILMNLLGNAVKFTEQGHIQLKVRALDHNEPDHVRLLFSVSDTGIGIPETVQGRIFDSFTQADESTARRYGGSGLGTTICKQLIELMGGHIGFSSVPGVGSEFWFELVFSSVPVNQQEADQTRSEAALTCLVVGSGTPSDRLVEMLEQISGRCPLVAATEDQAIQLAEQACLHGQVIGLVFISAKAGDVEAEERGSHRIPDWLQQLREAANNPCMAAVLRLPSPLPNTKVASLAQATGYFSSLPAEFDRETVRRQLYWAELVNRDRDRALVPAEPSLHALSLSSTEPARSLALEAFEVLIVEDNPTNRRVLQKILERAGHHCTVAKNGEEALDLVGRQVFDVIVLDMSMPGVHGIEVARVCRLMGGPASQVPIIMFSANVTPDARDESLRAGASVFMPKPIQVGPFLKTLEALVEGRRLAAEPALLPSLPAISAGESQPFQLTSEDPVLDLAHLSALESVSRDPVFFDELIAEYIDESKRLLKLLEQGLNEANPAQVREVLHALRGSSLGVGATAFKLACRRIEQMSQQDIDDKGTEIIDELNEAFHNLLVELARYRQSRREATSSVTRHT